jgi:aspartyl-tRNA synthetase
MPPNETINAVFKLGHFRSHVCGEVQSLEPGSEVCLEGWVWRLRELGGVTFIDLRDRFGTVQCKVEDKAAVHRFDVIRIRGSVQSKPQEAMRDASDKNEVVASSVEIVSATKPLPFSMDEEALETTRLKHRYLDIRNPEMWRKLKLKSDVYHFTRSFFQDRQFLEVETPMLYKSTPEGARDFLVPSRMYPGQFYALPQSPQTLKQLLMVGGIDRYFQIVKCFRDEDLRRDRQPEFTQLDVECSFVNDAEVISLISNYFLSLLDYFGYTLKNKTIPQISFNDAMSKYGTDAPDLRYPDLTYKSLRSVFEQFPFTPFETLLKEKRSDVTCLSFILEGEPPSRSVLSKLEEKVKKAGAGGLLWIVQSSAQDETFKSNAKKYFTQAVRTALTEKTGDFTVGFVLAGGPERFGWMHELRRSVIDQFKMKPVASHALCWVTPCPVFIKTDQGITYNHHPFTSPYGDWIDKILKSKLSEDELLDIPAQAYDIVMNGSEVGGGSIRIHQPELQQRVFEALGLSPEEVKEKFGFLIEALGYGAPPHGGIALGMDRIVSVMDGGEAIRDYIAFPKTQNGQCLMSQAPSDVHGDQLKELGIHLKT